MDSTLKPEELFRNIVQEIREAVPCERCVIGTFNLESGENHYWHVESEIDISDFPAHGGPKYYWHKEVIEGHRPVYFPDIRKIRTPRTDELAAAGLRSYLIVPILQGNEYQAHILLFRQNRGS